MDELNVREFSLKNSEIMNATKHYRENAMAHVTKGCLAIRELNFYGVSRSIPAGESAIKALIQGQDLRIYGMTSGTHAHLFVYDPHPLAEHVIDLGRIGEDKDTSNRLVMTKSGALVGSASPSGKLFSYNSSGDYSLLWKEEHNPILLHEPPVPGSTISTLCSSSRDGAVYGLAQPAGTLFSWQPEADVVEQCANLQSEHLSRVLVEDEKGRLWGAKRNGCLFYYDLAKKQVEHTGLRLPGGKGLNFLNEWDASTDCHDGIIYGGTIGGYFFELDTGTSTIRSFGKPIAGPRIRALVFGKDGTVYGIAGKPGQVSHLFQFDPTTSELEDLGVPLVSFPKIWTGYEFDALACGDQGQIYLGESDRISHLFIYYPPVKQIKSTNNPKDRE